MPKIIPHIICALVLHEAANCNSAMGLSLKEAFARAQSASQIKGVEIEDAKLRQADAALAQAQSSLLPHLSASASYLRADFDDEQKANQTSAKLTLLQNLFRGGRDSESVAVAESVVAAQKYRIESARLALYQQVAEAYFAVQSTSGELSSLKELQTIVQKRLSDIKNRIRIGRSRFGDQLTAETQIALVGAQIEKAEDEHLSARRNLALLIGTAPESLKANFDRPQIPNLRSVEEYLATLSSRPDLMALQQEILSAQQTVELARAEHWPTIDLAANYHLERPEPNKNVKWDVGVSISVPLYAGGAIKNKIHSQTEKAFEKKLLFENARVTALNEMSQIHARILSLKAQIKSYDEVIRISDRNFQEQNRDYQLGLQSSLEVLQALNTLQENRRARDKTLFQLLSSFHRLEALAGRLP